MEIKSYQMPSFPKGEPAFMPLLKEHRPFVPKWGNVCPDDCLDVRGGMRLKVVFKDGEKLLETAYADMKRFLSEAGIDGDAVTCKIVKSRKAMETEAYRVSIDDNVTIEAADTEGVRRAVYWLMDQLKAAPFLKRGVVERKPWLKNRISRCFFGPIKRPPHNIDELMNDIDYYPEEYLSLLAQEGINGLWLTITFREICDTTLRPACADAAKRLSKLRDTVERCRRYGIKIWAFCIEPAAWSSANPLPKSHENQLACGWSEEKSVHGSFPFCVNSPEARQYLEECTYSLFSSVPHLGGIINISYGERPTSCLSRFSPLNECGKLCENCSFGSPKEIFKAVNASMARGMKRANPTAEFISWLYIPYAEQIHGWVYELPKDLDGEVVVSFNFESGVTRSQLGRTRAGGDYWLSAVGPSDRFCRMAQSCEGHAEMSAKIQVGCSHEVATIPYVPVPGILYRKYREMKRLGVRHVMQCWYFGNYPGLMNEAAGKLAFEDFSNDEDAFLQELAMPDWGADAAHAVAAWKLFAEAYGNYPLDIQFQYYGPMHDGPVWPLHLKYNFSSLTRSWQPDAFPSGDAIGECLANFRLDEAERLCTMLSAKWHEGLLELRKTDADRHRMELSLAEALDIQFASAANILRFYAMRHALTIAEPQDARSFLLAMRKIVQQEITASERLAELCEQDGRLGYHSEAEVFKYFPEKLRWRAKQLKKLLDTDFKDARQTLSEGDPLEEYLFEDEREAWAEGDWREVGKENMRWRFSADSETVKVEAEFSGHHDYPETAWLIVYDREGLSMPLPAMCVSKQSSLETYRGWLAEFTIPRAALGYASHFRLGIERTEYLPNGTTRASNSRKDSYPRIYRLNLGVSMIDKTQPVIL